MAKKMQPAAVDATEVPSAAADVKELAPAEPQAAPAVVEAPVAEVKATNEPVVPVVPKAKSVTRIANTHAFRVDH